MFKKNFNVIFVISGELASFWRVFVKFRWHGQKLLKAAKEVAAKQAANAPVVSKMSKDVIVKVNKDPVLVTTVLKLVPEKSNIFNWLTMGTSVEETQSEDILVVEKEEKTK